METTTPIIGELKEIDRTICAFDGEKWIELGGVGSKIIWEPKGD